MRFLLSNAPSRFSILWVIAMVLGSTAVTVQAQGTNICHDIYREEVREIHANFIEEAKSCGGDSVCIAQARDDKAEQQQEAVQRLLDCRIENCKVDWEPWRQMWDLTAAEIYNELQPELARLLREKLWTFRWKFHVKIVPNGTVEAELDRHKSYWSPNSAAAKRAFDKHARYLKQELEKIHASFPQESKKPFVIRTPIFATQGFREPSPIIEEVDQACIDTP